MKLGHKDHLNTSNKFPMRFFPNPKIFFSILDELKEPRFWEKQEKIHQIEGARGMYSFQDWR
jgi:hypothetical protein